MRARSGFTLVEILIVVIILGILAAIVIPQFSDASTQARESSCKSSLQTMRAQIQLYEVEHNDDLPGDGGATFKQAMTGLTDIDGDVSTDPNDYGPYIDKIPTNPYDDSDTVTEGTSSPAPGDGAGWYFNTDTGHFSANDSSEHAAW